MRIFKTIFNKRGASGLLFTMVLSTIVVTSTAMAYMYLINRAKYQNKIRQAYKMQTVFEELAKYFLKSREVYQQIVISPGVPCPLGTFKSRDSGGGAQLPTAFDPTTFGLGVCWSPPPLQPGVPFNGNPAPTVADLQECLGIAYMGEYYCLAAPNGLGVADTIASHDVLNDISGKAARRSTRSSGVSSGMFFRVSSGVLFGISRLLDLAYAGYGSYRTDGAWSPACSGDLCNAGVRPPTLLNRAYTLTSETIVGYGGGLADSTNLTCGAGAAGPMDLDFCMTLSVCPVNTSNCVHSQALPQIRIRLVGVNPSEVLPNWQ